MIKRLRQIGVSFFIIVFLFQAYSIPVLAYENVFSGVEQQQGIYFSDIQQNGEKYWASEAIYQMYAFGIVQGFEKGLYKPYINVTRAEALAFIQRALGSEKQAGILAEKINELRNNGTNSISSTKDWSDGYIGLALGSGLITKAQYNDAFSSKPIEFKKNGYATRQEIAYWVAVAFGISPSYNNSLTNVYKDSNLIDSEIRPYINALINERIMVGSDGRINPLASITRAEMAQILLNCESYITTKLGIKVQSGVITSIPSKNVVEIGSNIILLDAEKEEGMNVFANGRIGSISLLRPNDTISYYVNSVYFTI